MCRGYHAAVELSCIHSISRYVNVDNYKYSRKKEYAGAAFFLSGKLSRCVRNFQRGYAASKY